MDIGKVRDAVIEAVDAFYEIWKYTEVFEYSILNDVLIEHGLKLLFKYHISNPSRDDPKAYADKLDMVILDANANKGYKAYVDILRRTYSHGITEALILKPHQALDYFPSKIRDYEIKNVHIEELNEKTTKRYTEVYRKLPR